MDPSHLSCFAWKEELERRRREIETEDGPPRKIFASLKEYNEAQRAQMLGDDNRYYTILSLRDRGELREPTRFDLADHFEGTGGSDNFRRLHCFRLLDVNDVALAV